MEDFLGGLAKLAAQVTCADTDSGVTAEEASLSVVRRHDPLAPRGFSHIPLCGAASLPLGPAWRLMQGAKRFVWP